MSHPQCMQAMLRTADGVVSLASSLPMGQSHIGQLATSRGLLVACRHRQSGALDFSQLLGSPGRDKIAALCRVDTHGPGQEAISFGRTAGRWAHLATEMACNLEMHRPFLPAYPNPHEVGPTTEPIAFGRVDSLGLGPTSPRLPRHGPRRPPLLCERLIRRRCCRLTRVKPAGGAAS